MINVDLNQLRSLYIAEGLNLKEISNIYECSPSTIRRRLKQAGIEKKKPLYQDEKWLRNLYKEEKKSILNLADKCECHPGTIYKWIKKFDIELRDKSEILSLKCSKKYHNKDWLYSRYIEDKMSLSAIADLCGCSVTPIHKWLLEYDIDIRGKVEASLLRNKSSCRNYRKKEWLRKKYIDEKLSSVDISKICECDPKTILRWIDIFNIEKRDMSTALLTSLGDVKKYRNEEWLRDKYLISEMSSRDISDLCGCDKKTILRWLEKFNIARRESPVGKFGPESPNWKGGKSALKDRIRGLSDYKNWRSSVFERDNFTCQFCSKYHVTINADHIYPFSEILDDHNLQNVQEALECDLLWDINNGRTLCVPCHKKTETYGTRILERSQIEEIVTLICDTELSLREISNEFDVGDYIIYKINNGNIYRSDTDLLVDKFPIRETNPRGDC